MKLAAPAALLLFTTSCLRLADTPAIVTCIPPQSVWIVGVDVARMRASSLSSLVPENFRQADDLILTSDGRGLLFIERGTFATAPAGAVLLDPHLAVSGAPDQIQAAAAQYKTKSAGAADLLSHAAPVNRAPIWGVARGGIALPLSGNLANLNRLLHLVDYATLSIQLDSGVDITITGSSRDADTARHLEETLRALVTLAEASSRRAEDALRNAKIVRENTNVTASLTATAEFLTSLLSQ